MENAVLLEYTKYASAVAQLRSAVSSLSAFTISLKEDKQLIELRNKARSELQGIYDLVRFRFEMPAIPVYLPVRKKIMVRGQAHALGSMPQEIRIYSIHGPATKVYALWQPQDIIIDPQDSVLETVVHECAHVLEIHRHGVMGHECDFVSAYCDIEMSLIAARVCRHLSSLYRYSGCPAGSYAARQFGRSGLGRA
jgi:hypothetical protein